MKQIIVLLFSITMLFGCKKKTNSKNNPYLNLAYAAKYAPRMEGEKLWHRYTIYRTVAGNDSVINLTDTTLLLLVIDDTIVSLFFDVGSYAALKTDTGNILYFYTLISDYFNQPVSSYTAYYFPLTDSISLINQPDYPGPVYYFHSP